MQQDAGRQGGGRALARSLLQDPNLSVGAIARQVGVSKQTVEGWNARWGLRPPRPRPRTLEAWPQARREAAVRILSAVEVDPADVAEALGYCRASAETLLATFGLAGREPGAAGGQAVTDPRRLRMRLRAHIGRQIEALDAALSHAPKAGFDSAKVLRDLGGLKRLLDDLGSGGEAEGKTRDEPARSDPDALDPDELRAEIARRLDRFVADGTADAIPG